MVNYSVLTTNFVVGSMIVVISLPGNNTRDSWLTNLFFKKTWQTFFKDIMSVASFPKHSFKPHNREYIALNHCFIKVHKISSGRWKSVSSFESEFAPDIMTAIKHSPECSKYKNSAKYDSSYFITDCRFLIHFRFFAFSIYIGSSCLFDFLLLPFLPFFRTYNESL